MSLSQLARNALCVPIRLYQCFRLPSLQGSCKHFSQVHTCAARVCCWAHGGSPAATRWAAGGMTRCRQKENGSARSGSSPRQSSFPKDTRAALEKLILRTTSPSLLRNATSPCRGGFGSKMEFPVLPRAPLLGELSSAARLRGLFLSYLLLVTHRTVGGVSFA